MMKRRLVLGCLFALAGPLGQPLFAIDPIAVPLGPVREPEETPAKRTQATVDMADDGSFVVSWLHHTPPTAIGKARRFAANGDPLTPVFDTGLGGIVSSAPDGSFVIVTPRVASPTVAPLEVRRYDAAGLLLGRFDLATRAYRWAVKHDSAGNFVVAWNGSTVDLQKVFAARFNAQGFQVGSDFEVGGPLSFGPGSIDIAIFADGRFNIFFEEGGPESPIKLYRRSYDADGLPLEAPVAVPPNAQQESRSATAADGRLAIAFHLHPWDIAGHFFDGAGNLGNSFVLGEPGEQALMADTYFLAGGDLAAASNIDSGDGSFRLRLHRLGADGLPRGPRLEIGDPLEDYDANAPVTAGRGDRMVVAWSDSSGGVHFRQLEATLFADGFESGGLAGWSAATP